MSAEERVIVVGAGISGLACALALARGGVDVRVLEAGARAGGVIGTIDVDGFRFETGPTTIPSRARGVRELAELAGIADRLVVSSPDASTRYLLHRGKLVALPRSPLGFLATRLLSARAKAQVLSEPLRRFTIPSDRSAREPTLEEFLAERIGAEATRRLAGAFVRGVYAAEIGDLGAASAFPRLWRRALEHGGIARGMLAAVREREPAAPLPGPPAPRSRLLSLERGLGELPEAAARALGERLALRTRVRTIEHAGGDGAAPGFTVTTERGERHACRALVLAVPAPVAHELLAPLLAGSFARDHLAHVGHAAVTLVHLGFSGAALPRGFGFLVPPEEAEGARGARLLGALFVSNLFAGRVRAGVERAAAVTAFFASDTLAGLGQREIVALARTELDRVLHPRPALEASTVMEWRDVIPRYAPGHAQRIAELERELAQRAPGLHLAGSYTAGVSVEDCIQRGFAIARALGATPALA